jgi:hypothetical protein
MTLPLCVRCCRSARKCTTHEPFSFKASRSCKLASLVRRPPPCRRGARKPAQATVCHRGGFRKPIEARLLGLLEEAHGKEWLGAQGWSVGLPDTWGMIDGEGDERCVENNPKLVNFNLIIWLWTLAKAFDMVQFGRYRCE